MNDIYNAFHEFFEIIEADSVELRQEVYRLRYQVLCVDGRLPGFNSTFYPKGLEEDEYDRHSCHILLRHRASDSFIGTVRLILQDPINPKKPFPIEDHMQIDPELVDLNALPRQNAAEISRFVILSRFTQRRLEHPSVEKKSPSKKNKLLERRRFPHVGLALVVGIVQMCAAYKIDHWFSVMNPSLNRLLSYFGSDLNAVGPFGDYHGMRRPYYIKLKDVLAKMYQGHRDVWELMTEYGKSCPYSMKYIRTKSSYCLGAYLNRKNKATNNLIKENILI